MERDIYLDLIMRKSSGNTDAEGNYIFEVEASNENLDLQNQVVLQSALMESKDKFLKGGVISYDHLHKRRAEDGSVISDPAYVIGEPIDVRTEGKSTIVKGKLYGNNPTAQKLIDMLKAGSTRVRASVGGILPDVVKNTKTGVEKIRHVFWNDLALTVSPVNYSVGSAQFAKSLTSAEFVKALQAGYETDSVKKTGGEAIIAEDVHNKVMNTNNDMGMLQSLQIALESGEIKGTEQAIGFLLSYGMNEADAWTFVREIIAQGGKVMKKSLHEKVASILKSLTGGIDDSKNTSDTLEKSNKCDTKKSKTADDDESINLDGNDDDGNDDDDVVEKGVKKSWDDMTGDAGDEDIITSGDDVLKSLTDEIDALKEHIAEQDKSMLEMSKALTSIGEGVYAIGGEKIPPRSLLAKSMTASDANSSSDAMPTQDDYATAMLAMHKACVANRIDELKSATIMTDFRKSMVTGEPMNAEYRAILCKEVARMRKEAE